MEPAYSDDTDSDESDVQYSKTLNALFEQTEALEAKLANERKLKKLAERQARGAESEVAALTAKLAAAQQGGASKLLEEAVVQACSVATAEVRQV